MFFNKKHAKTCLSKAGLENTLFVCFLKVAKFCQNLLDEKSRVSTDSKVWRGVKICVYKFTRYRFKKKREKTMHPNAVFQLFSFFGGVFYLGFSGLNMLPGPSFSRTP